MRKDKKMNNIQSGILMNIHSARINSRPQSLCAHIGLGLFLLIFQIASVRADELALSGIDFASQPGDRLQIEMEMSGSAIAPKIFKTDNPARIALDFPGVKSALAKKMYPINQGAASSVYVVEAAGRVRVVVNLIEATPFETKVVGNKVLLTLTRAKASMPVALTPVVAKVAAPVATRSANAVVAALIPAQAISGFDFKRGDKGEGRILVSLANPNTIVNSKEQGGKVIISFLNTHLPENLAKRLDVSEFATPVKFIDTVASDQQTTITVAMQNELYDYSVFQADGLLTVEFRPLSNEEKDALDRSRTKYSGDKLSLNFQEIEIRSVIAILAEFTGQNVVAGDDVTGTITLKLDDVPWDEALDFIMMTKDLGKYETGNVTLISPLDKIKDYKKKQQETEKVVEQLDPLVTEYIKINYAKAENFRNLLNGKDTGAFGSCGVTGAIGTASSVGSSASSSNPSSSASGQGTGASGSGGDNEKFGLLSARGSAVVDARTNTLIVRETTKRLDEVKKLIRRLDVPVRQVMIEARVVIADDSFTENLGVKFGAAKQNADIGGGKSFAVGGTGTRGTTTGGAGNATPLLVDLGVSALSSTPPGALGMTLARGADYVLNLELQALQIEGKGEIISNPRVMTMDRCTAVMKQGVEIPVTTSSATGSASTTGGGAPGGVASVMPTTEYKDAVLELNVTPQITPSGSVIMNLLVKKDNKNETSNPVSGNPGIDKREIKTSVLVEDGETVVLGGVYEGADSIAKNKIPFFADLPGIGFLFTNSSVKKAKKELLIFVTPKIMQDNLASD
jgi:type IV pilus assembly protein PilQ